MNIYTENELKNLCEFLKSDLFTEKKYPLYDSSDIWKLSNHNV